jgi:hypothetical protein
MARMVAHAHVSSPQWWDERCVSAVVALSSRTQQPSQGAVAPAAAAAAAQPLAYVDLDCAYLRKLVLQALARRPGWRVQTPSPTAAAAPAEECTSPEDTAFCWSEYERTDWTRVLAGKQSSAAYCVRKGLIRKSQWCYNVKKYAAKRPDSMLARGVPETLLFEFYDVEYMDEALAEVYEVRDMATDGSEWWMLKPSMTNQGRGLVVFNKLSTLVEALSADGADEVREWVLQRYIRRPLLCGGAKFHLRVYALAVGALTAYVYTDVLTLFSLTAYAADDPANVAAHITNTCCQSPADAAAVAAAVGLLRDLPGRLVADAGGLTLPDASARCERVFADCAALVGDAFSAVSSELSFLALPRSFELYGFDMLVDAEWKVWLLEANAEPDFAQTGAELERVVAGVVEGALSLGLDEWFPSAAQQHADGRAASLGYVKVYERADPRAAGSAMTFA